MIPVRINCTPMAITIRPMKRVTVSWTRPSPLARRPIEIASTIPSHMPSVATATAINAVTGKVSFECAAAKVITPVMVPGLAAKRMSGPSETFWLVSSSCARGWSLQLLLSIENLIQDNTPPPATENASSDTPKRCRTRVPMSAARVKMTRTVIEAMVASISMLGVGGFLRPA